MTSLRTARRNRDLKGVAFSVKMDMIDTVVEYKYITNQTLTISTALQLYQLKYQNVEYQGTLHKTTAFNDQVGQYKRDLLYSYNSRTTQLPYTKHIQIVFKKQNKKKTQKINKICNKKNTNIVDHIKSNN
eukprot:89467_1